MLFKRSFLQELITTASAALLILVGIVIAQRTAYYIDVASDGTITTASIKTLLGFSLLRFMPMILSLTLFLSVLLTLTRLYRDSEMVIWFSSGLSISHWIRPVLTFSIPIALLIGAMSLIVMPWATQKANHFRDQLEAKDDTSAVSPGMFKESKSADRVFFVESFDELGNVVKNVFIQSTQHEKLGVITSAQGSRKTVKNGDQYLVLENGRRYEGGQTSQEFTSTLFEKYAVRIKPNEVDSTPLGTKEQSTLNLIKTMSPHNNAELQWRMAMPLSAMILALMAIPLSFVDPRAGRSVNVIVAVFLYIIYNNLLSIMQAWVAQGKLNPMIGLWPVHIIFLVITLYLFRRRGQHLPLVSIPQFLRKVWR
jgi:lipopolysaccharide export system permease protein